MTPEAARLLVGWTICFDYHGKRREAMVVEVDMNPRKIKIIGANRITHAVNVYFIRAIDVATELPRHYRLKDISNVRPVQRV